MLSIPGSSIGAPYTGENDQARPPWQPVIYRRVLQRRVYPTGGNTSAATTISYPRSEHATGVAGTFTFSGTTYINSTTIQKDAFISVKTSGTGLTSEVESRHTFYDLASTNLLLSPDQRGPANPFTGKPYQTESPGLRRQETRYMLVGIPGILKPCQQTTVLMDGSTEMRSAKLFVYEANFQNLIDTYEYGYGAAPDYHSASYLGVSYETCEATPPTNYVRRTHADYVIDPDYTGSDKVHLRDLTSAVFVYGPSGSMASETRYFYDAQSDGSKGCGADSDSQNLASASGIYGHTETVAITRRGNAWCTTRWRNLPSAAWISTKDKFDVGGNIVTAKDAAGNRTTFSYSSNCARYGYLGSVTNALQFPVVTTYDCDLGKPSQITDPNNYVTGFSYSDALDRLSSATEAGVRKNGKHVSAAEQHAPIDGRRRERSDQSQRSGTPEPHRIRWLGPPDRVRGLWGQWRRRVQDRDPVRCLRPGMESLEPIHRRSAGWTENTYDAIGRVTKVTRSDQSYVLNTHTVSISPEPTERTLVRDENGKQRALYTDALGRLSRVIEDPSSLNYTTTYGYDALGNLTGVTQDGQSRSFTYDSLARLLTATNPETGTITYTYDGNGNVLTREEQRKVPTAADHTEANYCTNTPLGCQPRKTTFAYDALNRLTSKTYNDGFAANPTPPVRLCYDGRDLLVRKLQRFDGWRETHADRRRQQRVDYAIPASRARTGAMEQAEHGWNRLRV